MNQEKPAYLKPVGRYAFKHPSGENGQIIGVTLCTPEGCEERLCFVVSFGSDPFIDRVPLSEVKDWQYKIVGFREGN